MIGRDGTGRTWFKSDMYLSDITGAVGFYVVDDCFLWRSRFLLKATVPYNEDIHGKVYDVYGYSYKPKYYDKTIGVYKTLSEASYAIEDDLMPLLGIREILGPDPEGIKLGK